MTVSAPDPEAAGGGDGRRPTWYEFQTRFGGALRSKHTVPERAGYRLDDAPRGTGDLPAEFIRLCPWEAEYLFVVARRARRGIIEVGRFNGGSLFVMAAATPPGVPLCSIDRRPQDDGRLRGYLDRHLGDATVTLIVGDSQRRSYPEVGAADLLFIDGDHSYEGCLADLRNWYPKLLPGGHLVLHDCYNGRNGVQDALLDFMQDQGDLQIVQSPFIGANHWHYPAGSLAHLVRRP